MMWASISTSEQDSAKFCARPVVAAEAPYLSEVRVLVKGTGQVCSSVAAPFPLAKVLRQLLQRLRWAKER